MKRNLQNRKNLRIPQYNYSTEGLYFITICVKDRKCILSEIENNNDMPSLKLLPYGEITEKYLNSINMVYDDLKIKEHIIMPNHIHFICEIKDGSSRTPTPTNAKIPAFVSTLKRLVNKECNDKIWQRNYYEHIIRNERECLEIVNYIQNNPYKWEKDKYYI